MNIIYEGTDITGFVIVNGCIYKDVSHGRADVIEILFRRPAAWHRWQPETDDEIQVVDGNLDTGKMFVNTVVPQGEFYKMIATSLPSKALRTTWDFFRDMTLEDVIRRCASECGMESRIYGVEGAYRYSTLMRENEGCAAFAERICQMEGVALKAFNGAFRGIGIEYAQGLAESRAWTLEAEQNGVRYEHRPGIKYSAITVRSPWAEASARDTEAENGAHITIGGLSAMDNATAGRWARGLLLCHNREADRLRIEMKLDIKATAMVKARIDGNTGANGHWLIDEAIHDLYNGRTTVNLLRVVESII